MFEGVVPGIFWHGSWVNPDTMDLGKTECRRPPCACHLAATSSVPCMLLTTPTLLGECGPGLRLGQGTMPLTSESSYNKTILLLGFTGFPGGSQWILGLPLVDVELIHLLYMLAGCI